MGRSQRAIDDRIDVFREEIVDMRPYRRNDDERIVDMAAYEAATADRIDVFSEEIVDMAAYQRSLHEPGAAVVAS
jgi:hypothetical protein